MKTILEQPRRGKTREALITPHKRSAVWGLTHKTGPDCGVSDNDNRSAVWGKACTAIAALCCVFVMAVLCTACDRDRQALTGDYSYKLSGEVALTDEDGAVTYRLIHRNGQMNILRDKSDKDRYIITMLYRAIGFQHMRLVHERVEAYLGQHSHQHVVLNVGARCCKRILKCLHFSFLHELPQIHHEFTNNNS